ncbi:MAG: hypothetical protein WCJ45_00450 [bacterium]
MLEFDNKITLGEQFIPETILIMGYRLYFISFKKICLILEESFSHKHSDTSLGKDKSIKVNIEEIDDIFDKKSNTENTKTPRNIVPNNISIQYNKCDIEHQQENERLQSQCNEYAAIMSDYMKNTISIHVSFHDLFS